MEASIKRASWLLRNYPELWRQVRERREDLLERRRQGAYVELARGYDPSDPTGRRGAELADLSLLSKEVDLAERFIDSLGTQAERKLLVQVWRFHYAGWDVVASTLGWEVGKCKAIWSAMSRGLGAELENRQAFAGVVTEAPGIASASGPRSALPE